MTISPRTTLFTPIAIDPAVLAGYYGARAGLTTAAAAAGKKAAGSAPSAPWSKGVTPAALTAAC